MLGPNNFGPTTKLEFLGGLDVLPNRILKDDFSVGGRWDKNRYVTRPMFSPSLETTHTSKIGAEPSNIEMKFFPLE